MSVYREKRGPNWGAALAAVGGGLQDYAEQKRREMAMQMLREQSLADREAARQQELADQQAGYQREDLKAEQMYGRVLPDSLSLPGGQATMGALGGMRVKPATDVLQDWYPQQRQGRVATPDVPDYYMQTPDGGYTGFSGQPWSAAGEGRRVNISGTYQDRPVVSFENWSAPTKDAAGPRAATPSEERLAASELQKRIAAAVEGDIGNPATLLRNMTTYDDKGKKTGTSFVDVPSRGGGQFINHEDFGYFENPEAAGNAYAGSLADSLALRGITTYDQLPGGVVPQDMRRNAWGNVVESQPTVADMDFTLPLIADMKEPGWKFSDKGTADPSDDEFVKKRRRIQGGDMEMPVTDFMRTMVTPKADAEGRIEFKAFDAMFKKQYGVKYSDLIKGTAPEGF